VSFVGSNDMGARKAAVSLPVRSSMPARAESMRSTAMKAPAVTPETIKLKHGTGGMAPARREGLKLGPEDTCAGACQDKAPDNKKLDGKDLPYRRMTVAARLYKEHYNVNRRSQPIPAASEPLVKYATKLGVSTGSSNTIISSWRWEEADDENTRVYHKSLS